MEVNLNNLFEWKQILLSHYKSLSLSEEETMVILMVDFYKNANLTPINQNTLSLKMRLNSTEIDKIISKLIKVKIIDFEESGNLSVESFKNRLFDIQRKEIIADTMQKQSQSSNKFSELFDLLQESLQRSMSALEIDQVKNWLDNKIKIDIIKLAINNCKQKMKKVSFMAIDKEIKKILKSEDIAKEGYTPIDENTGLSYDEAVKIVRYNWLKDESK